MSEQEPHTRIPTKEEIYASEIYFAELEDALDHYSSPLPPGMYHTLTVRTNEERAPQTELVSETRFPPLDDMPEHFERLKYAARQLDKLPVSYWDEFYDNQLHHHERLPCYVRMQIVLYGTSNTDGRAFEKISVSHERLLSNFSWTEVEDSDHRRDNAEECKRILSAYGGLADEIRKLTPQEQSPVS